MTAFVVERTVRCASAVEPLWALLTDTERMNRAIGMDRVAYQPLSTNGSARFLASTRLGGFRVEYEEKPFEWVYLKRFSVVRIMRNGPASELSHAVSFAPGPPGTSGTEVTVRLRIDPRIGLLTPFIKRSARQTLGRFEREIRRVDAAILAGEGAPVPTPRRRGAVDGTAIADAAARLASTDAAPLVQRLVALVREGGDLDAARMRPFALADAWGADRREVLALMLHAVPAGLLELRWEIVCPSCRVATESVGSLAELKTHGECQLCEISFGLALDEAVEASFAPAAGIRTLDLGPYCIGGPARVPHVVSQGVMAAHGSVDLDVPTEDRRLRVFVRGGQSGEVDVRAGAPALAELHPTAERPEEGIRPRLEVAPGGIVRVHNPTDAERHAKLERSTWASQAATARDVTALPAFRRDFAADILRPGASLRISRVTLFFSDLTGSTELYSTVGDAAAFRLVQDHFDVVLAILAEHHGALVKTIGDAVMAAFTSDDEALVASLAVLREFEKFRLMHPHNALTHIKLGVFGGPCYVVTANGVLDYFGQTVNIAARLQAQAASGELVVDEALADRAVERGVLAPELVKARYAATLKGVHDTVRVARIAVGA